MHWLAEHLQLDILGGEPVFPQFKILGFPKRPLTLEGNRRGNHIRIYPYTVSSGQSSTTYTTVRTSIPNPNGLTFSFGKEGLFSKIGKSLGMQDIDTGDEHFDKIFRVKRNDESFIQQALLPEVKAKFLASWTGHKAAGKITLKEDLLSYDETGIVRDEAARDRIAAITELICDLGGIVQFYNR
jgi:hypothetical protein